VVTATDTAGVVDLNVEAVGWPLQPLLAASGLTRTQLAAQLGLSAVTLRAVTRRGLADRQADEWAIRVGLHPLLVWGWAWIDSASGARRPAAARLADALRERIARGDPGPGERLPGVHALADTYGVSAKTVARAFDELRAEGVVVGGIGRGRPAIVGGTMRAPGSVDCVACGRPIEPGDEHYPHRRACTLAAHGWCDCDGAAHPECCPACATGRAS
jgi:hypothetical protein